MNEAFYATQSNVSDPGTYVSLFDGLPDDFAAISSIAKGLVYLYVGDQYIYGYQPPEERMGEVDTRLIERMLARLMEMDNRPLTEARSFENRMLGSCRDFALLACAILRHQHVPARLRYGFASYIVPDYWLDHVIVEAWNGTNWKRFDPEFAIMEVADTAFATGGRVWQMCHGKGVDPAHFGLGPDVPDVSGLWFIRGRVQLDIAALNKQELLCWDEWQFGQSPELSSDDEVLLNQAALLSLDADSTALRGLIAREARLDVPETVLCHSPALGPHDVEVS